MLVISRRPHQDVVFPDLGITVTVLQVRGQVVRLGIQAPPQFAIGRKEILFSAKFAPPRERPTNRSPDNDRPPHETTSETTSDATEHRRRNQLNTLQLIVDAVQMRIQRGERVDVEDFIETLVRNMDLNLNGDLNGDREVGPIVSVDQSSHIDGPDFGDEVDSRRPLRVLVVEDCDNERGLMTCLLASYGFIVYVARDGIEALEQLSFGCGLPDVVLMDIDMPLGNGHDAMLRLRGDATLRHLVIYAVTGSRRNRSVEPAGRGWDRWFEKPVDVKQLVDAMMTDCQRIPVRKETTIDVVNA